MRSLRRTFNEHWPEYLIEGWCLATFMLSACLFGAVLFYPHSPLAFFDVRLRTVLMGLAMGSTAVAIVCSPWGKRSGAHFNPAVTLTFLRLRKVSPADAFFYVTAQFAGGVLGVFCASLILADVLSDKAVNYVATLPGMRGLATAFVAETTISFLMMTMILFTSNSRRIAHLTPFLAGLLVTVFISVENPLSGMSMNPARTFASAFVGHIWSGWWIYFIAPPTGMLAASELFLRVRGLKAIRCAKLHHRNKMRCIFNCGYGDSEQMIEVTKHPQLFPTITGLF